MPHASTGRRSARLPLAISCIAGLSLALLPRCAGAHVDFFESVRLAVEINCQAVTAGDLDGDGAQDVIVANGNDDIVMVLLASHSHLAPIPAPALTRGWLACAMLLVLAAGALAARRRPGNRPIIP